MMKLLLAASLDAAMWLRVAFFLVRVAGWKATDWELLATLTLIFFRPAFKDLWTDGLKEILE